MTKLAVSVFVSVVGLFQAWGCGVACTANIVTGLVVTVVDTDGVRLCDADVVVTSGDYTETFSHPESSSECVYSGLQERGGTYSVAVSRSGYASQAVERVVVEDGGCHVTTEEISVTMTPL